MSLPEPKHVSFKASVAMSLLAEEVDTRRLQRLSGSELPKGKTRMQYTPADMLNIRARLKDLDPDEVRKAMAKNKTLPVVIVTRMTKGGIGKTTTIVNSACALAKMGFRCLLIDGDPQSSATNMLGISTEELRPHIGDLLMVANNKTPDDLSPYIIPIFQDGFLDLIPSDVDLDATNPKLTVATGREQRAEDFLKRNTKFLAQHYDVILVDTNPSTNSVSNAFTYLGSLSGKVLTVVEPEGSCLRALDALRFNLEDMQRVARKPIDIAILINKTHQTRTQNLKNYAILKQNYSSKILPVQITQSAAFSRQVDADSVESSLPVVLREPSSKSADLMYQLARVLVNEFKIVQPGFPATEK